MFEKLRTEFRTLQGQITTAGERQQALETHLRQCCSREHGVPLAGAPRQVVREYSYVFAAVAPAQGRLTALILPASNTTMMNLLLEHVAHDFVDHLIIMHVDRAGWHRTKELVIPENIRLLPQPAHSPELNPVEHIWDDLHEKHSHNHALPSLDAVEATLVHGLRELIADHEPVRSMTYFPHFRSAI